MECLLLGKGVRRLTLTTCHPLSSRPCVALARRLHATVAQPPPPPPTSSSSSPSSSSPSPSFRAHGAASRGEGRRGGQGTHAKRAGPTSHGTADDREDVDTAAIRQLVRDAVLNPHQAAASAGDTTARASRPSASFPLTADDSSVYDVQVFDRNGMPADLPAEAPASFDDLLSLAPDPLRHQLQEMLEKKHWSSLTSVQKHVIPFILEYRDVLCVAPTATGKTFAYVYPTMLRLLLDGQQAQRGRTRVGADGEEDPRIRRPDVERLLQEKINKGEVCRYCELDVREVRLCPMTGSPHAPPPEDDTDEMYMGSERRAQRLQELTSVAAPKALVLVPTSQLAFQVHGVFQLLNSDLTIRYMVRASSAEEQQKHLRALQDGVDVLITTPETILPALFKRKLSLQQVRTLVLDEVDDLVSVNHYDKLKIILGALPRASAAERPQRLLFGASLPPVAYNMLKERTLQPSHRFILADVRRDSLGHPVTATRTLAASEPHRAGTGRSGSLVSGAVPASALAPGQPALLTVNASIQHFVLMLGRVEKLHKLAWLYQTGKLTLDQRVLIFCNSRHNVAYVADQLPKLVPGLAHVTTITSHASASARAGVMKQFAGGLSTCLVATDIVSRGIDFRDVVYVVNYDMPLDMETFVHRCGRCGRRQPSQWMPRTRRPAAARRRPARDGEEQEDARVAGGEEEKGDKAGSHDGNDDDDNDNDNDNDIGSTDTAVQQVLPRGTSGYVYTFFQPENVKLAKPFVAYLRQNGQLVPPMLGEYARQSFVDVFRNSLFHHPTRPYRKSDPQNSTPVNGRSAPRYPDYKQEKINRHFRPL